MASISIKVLDDNQIHFLLSSDINDENKRALISWWKPENLFYLSKINDFKISYEEFELKKNWLRSNWTDNGHQVNFINLEKLKSLINITQQVKDEFNRIANSIDHGNDVNPKNSSLKRELTNFQRKNLQNLISMPNGANFSVPGAGKTMMTLLTWDHFYNEGAVSKLLVICPRSAFEAWSEEPKLVFKKTINSYQFSNESIPNDADIIFCNYEQLENEERLNRLKKWASKQPTMMAIDEAHRIKGGIKSIRWRACFELSKVCSRVDLLTGTPMPQGEEDLRNLLSLSWNKLPKIFLTTRYLRNLQNGGIFVRTTKDELKLPEIKYHQIELDMHELQFEIYNALKKTYAGRFGLSYNDASYFGQRGKAVMTLIAACSNPNLLNPLDYSDPYLGLSWPPKEIATDKNLLGLLAKYSKHEMSTKFEWVAQFLKKCKSENKKVIVWTTFVGNILSLQKILEPYDPAVIYGAISTEDRKEQIAKFRNSKNCSVLITNAQTLGEGISLHHHCHDAVYVDRNYNAGLYLQSLDRIHRLGLDPKQETNIYILQSKQSIDMRIQVRLDLKIKRMGEYLNDNGLVEMTWPDDDSEEVQNSLGFDNADLDDLFSHLRNDNE